MSSTYERLSTLVGEELGRAGVQITPETELDDLPGWDSVALAGVLLAIETEFGVPVARSAADGVLTGADLARLCATR